jgi:aminomethyltransferase
MDESTNPYEAGLGWTVRLEKGDFIGREALAEVKSRGPARELIGLRALDRAIPRHGNPVRGEKGVAGAVTSGTYSFWLNQAIALASVQSGSTQVGARVEVEARGGGAAEVVSLPFYRGSVRRPGAPAKAQKAQ